MEDRVNLCDFEAEQVYNATLFCLYKIYNFRIENFSRTLPKKMSQRVNLTSNLAEIIKVRLCDDFMTLQLFKQCGFKEELSYYQFLYPNTADVRKLFMWFMD
jgi:hypothetical protein